MISSKVAIAICVATYKRPKLLENCLNSIGLLDIPENSTPTIVVVDNDENETAKHIIDLTKNSLPMPIYYFVEKERGIASARNRLLKEAINLDAELIGFIDDDEFPKQDWLIKHLFALEKYNADVVAGPVISTSGTNIPDTTKPKNKLNNGSTPRHIAAGNVFFKSSLTSKNGLWFDKTFNFTGGEDFNFFDRSSARGNLHAWTNDAIIYETVVPERTTKKYLFYRHFTGAINNVIQYKVNNGIFSTWVHFILKATGKAFGSIFAFLTYLISFDVLKLEKCIIKIASSIGYISGLLNIVVERYR
jgi:succinoglycan biosynthesis protein ExoM